jgi:transcriptional regulator with XRE-family HTH domain
MGQTDFPPLHGSFRDRLRVLMVSRGLNPRSLSLAAGLNPWAVRDILSGKSRNPLYSTVKKLADALKCTPLDLMPETDRRRAVMLDEAMQQIEQAFATPGKQLFHEAPRSPHDGGVGMGDLPVFGRPNEGVIPAAIDLTDPNPVDWVGRPEQLLGVENAFAIFAPDDAMLPKYALGDLLFVHPVLPPKPWRFVLWINRNGIGFIRRFKGGKLVGQIATATLGQIDPPIDEEIPYKDIRALYRIIGSMDGAD